MNQPETTEAQKFLEYKKGAKQAFREACRQLYGDAGCKKLADAAWYIATNAPVFYRYLQSDSVGSKSYPWLMLALADAFIIVQKLNDIKATYHSGDGKESAPKDALLPIPKKISDNCRRPSAEEGYAHILRGLISYHERMTMGDIPQKDFYLDALKFALTCVEEKIPK